MVIWKDNLFHFSTCACQPCAGAMLIFFVSFHVNGSTPKGIHVCIYVYILMKSILTKTRHCNDKTPKTNEKIPAEGQPTTEQDKNAMKFS